MTAFSKRGWQILRDIEKFERVGRTGKPRRAVAHADRGRAMSRVHYPQIAGHVDADGQLPQDRLVESRTIEHRPSRLHDLTAPILLE